MNWLIIWDVYNAWHEWFYERWRRGEAIWPGGYTIELYVREAEYNGFGGDF